MKRIFNNKPISKIDIKQSIQKLLNKKEFTHTNSFAFHSNTSNYVTYSNKINKNTINSYLKANNLFNYLSKKSFAKLPRHKTLTLPSLSPSMEKGSIAEWKKKVGDKVEPGESIAGIETDKAVVDFELNEECYIAKILKPNGSKDIELGTVR